MAADAGSVHKSTGPQREAITPRTMNPTIRRRVMASVRSRDTRPEMIVRRAFHAAGLRYRLHDRRLPGTPDIVLASRRLVVEVRGCFWHQHPSESCPIRKPAGGANQGYWAPKLARNVARDARTEAELEALDWHCIVVWECEAKDSQALANLIRVVGSWPITSRRGRPQTRTEPLRHPRAPLR